MRFVGNVTVIAPPKSCLVPDISPEKDTYMVKDRQIGIAHPTTLYEHVTCGASPGRVCATRVKLERVQ